MAEPDRDEAETIRVTVTGRGIDFTREIGIELLPRLIGLLVGPVSPGGEPTNTIHTERSGIRNEPSDVTATERPVGAAEYVREKRPQTSPDTILVLAGYLELHERRRPFSRDDLRRLMRIARLPEPANFPRDVGVAVSKGYIQPLDDGFQLTNTALDLIGQPGPLVPARNRTARPRRAAGARDDED
jgi:hypothetical protein